LEHLAHRENEDKEERLVQRDQQERQGRRDLLDRQEPMVIQAWLDLLD